MDGLVKNPCVVVCLSSVLRFRIDNETSTETSLAQVLISCTVQTVGQGYTDYKMLFSSATANTMYHECHLYLEFARGFKTPARFLAFVYVYHWLWYHYWPTNGSLKWCTTMIKYLLCILLTFCFIHAKLSQHRNIERLISLWQKMRYLK